MTLTDTSLSNKLVRCWLSQEELVNAFLPIVPVQMLSFVVLKHYYCPLISAAVLILFGTPRAHEVPGPSFDIGDVGVEAGLPNEGMAQVVQLGSASCATCTMHEMMRG